MTAVVITWVVLYLIWYGVINWPYLVQRWHWKELADAEIKELMHIPDEFFQRLVEGGNLIIAPDVVNPTRECELWNELIEERNIQADEVHHHRLRSIDTIVYPGRLTFPEFYKASNICTEKEYNYYLSTTPYITKEQHKLEYELYREHAIRCNAEGFLTYFQVRWFWGIYRRLRNKYYNALQRKDSR